MLVLISLVLPLSHKCEPGLRADTNLAATRKPVLKMFQINGVPLNRPLSIYNYTKEFHFFCLCPLGLTIKLKSNISNCPIGWKHGQGRFLCKSNNFKVPPRSNCRYPFFYIFVHNKSSRKILPNFKSITNIRTHVFWTFIFENLRPPLIFLVPGLVEKWSK